MSFNLNDLLIDENKGNSGIKLELGDTGAHIIAALPHTPEYNAEEARLNREYSPRLMHASGDQERQLLESEIRGKLWFRKVILGWENFTLAGKDFPYSEKNFVSLFTDFKYTRISGLLVSAVNLAVERGDFNQMIPTPKEQEEVAKK